MEQITGILLNKLQVCFLDNQVQGFIYAETESELDSLSDHISVKCEICKIEEKCVWTNGTHYEYCIVWKGDELLEVVNELITHTGQIGIDRFGWIFSQIQNFSIVKCKENAVIPKKAHASDSGYDVTIIDVVKQLNTKTTLYGTGIKVTPPHGYYFELVPRSSISKTGYILANNIGIIDRSYTGEIMVALTKINEDSPNIELPLKIAQLIPRQFIHFFPKIVDSTPETSRGTGGFGST